MVPLVQHLHLSHVQHKVLLALNDREDAFARELTTESGLRLRQVVGALRRLEGRKMVRRTYQRYTRFPRGSYNEAWRWQSLIELTPSEVR
jgi:DNA-binding MarR family transcriptional regulator